MVERGQDVSKGPDYHLADGRCICDDCGHEYRKHPEDKRWVWLTVLCDGTVVKL